MAWGALEVLKAWCEVRTGKTQVLQMLLKSGCVCVCAQLGHDLCIGRLLKRLGPKR